MPTKEKAARDKAVCDDLLARIEAERTKLRDNEIARWDAKEDFNPKFGLLDVLRGVNHRQQRAYYAAARALEAQGIISLEGHTVHSSDVVSNPFWKRRGGQNWRVRHSEETELTVCVLKPAMPISNAA